MQPGTSIRNILLACNGKDRRSLTNLQSRGRSKSYGKVFPTRPPGDKGHVPWWVLY